MRGAVLFTGGLVVGVGITFVVMWGLDGWHSPEVRELTPDASEHDRRIAALEDALRDARASPAAAQDARSPARSEPVTADEAPVRREPPEDLRLETPSEIDVEALLSALYSDRGRLLAKLVSEVLARGEEGFPVLEEFLEKVVSRRRGLAVFRRPKLAMPLLGTLLAREGDVAAFAEFLLEEEPADGRGLLAHVELLDYLAAFLAWDAGRYPALRQRVAERLTWMLDRPDRNFADILKTLGSLGVEVDVEVLERIISNPDERRHHRTVIDELIRRDSPEAVLTLRGFIEGRLGRVESSSLMAALHALVRMDDPSAESTLEGFIHARDPLVRESAILAYFSAHRALDALPLALELLNTGEDDARKRSLVWELNGINPELLEALRTDPGVIDDPKFRNLVEQTTRWSRTAGRRAIELLGLAATGRAIEEYYPEDAVPEEGGNPPTHR